MIQSSIVTNIEPVRYIIQATRHAYAALNLVLPTWKLLRDLVGLVLIGIVDLDNSVYRIPDRLETVYAKVYSLPPMVEY